MAGIAELALQLGHKVSGSDASVYPPMSTFLEQRGIHIFEGYEPWFGEIRARESGVERERGRAVRDEQGRKCVHPNSPERRRCRDPAPASIPACEGSDPLHQQSRSDAPSMDRTLWRRGD